MSRRPIAYNLVRLALGSMHTTPRGVDRIDFGYLSSLFENWPGECVGVMPTAIGMRFFSRDMVLRGRDRLAKLWSEEIDPARDSALASLKARLNGSDAGVPQLRKRRMIPDLAGLRRMHEVILGDGIRFGAPIRALPADALYLDIGHFGLSVPMTFRWLRSRPDVSPVFMLHDAIPLECPDMVAPDTVRAYRKIVEVTRRHARAIITPTRDAGAAITRFLDASEETRIPVHAVPLPIDGLFLTSAARDPELARHNYFVICGAIEPRKNHALLFRVWERLIARHGEAAPHLVIAGSPGHESGEIMAAVQGSAGLTRRIVFAPGLSSPALARVMAGARALLMPSFAEGFGLPPVEALSLGTPALLSDIGAHREASGAAGVFIPADDEAAWLDAIEKIAFDPRARQEALERIGGFTPESWTGYMAKISAILASID